MHACCIGNLSAISTEGLGIFEGLVCTYKGAPKAEQCIDRDPFN